MDYDVIVCGGGPSGTAAAMAAARRGARVLLIERYGFLGGNATSALVNPWMGHRWQDPQTGAAGSLIGGIFREVVARLAAEGALGAAGNRAAFDEQRLKFVYDRMLAEAGVELRLHTLLTGAQRQGSRVVAVDTFAKDGARSFAGKVFIDATGDGDLAAMSGCDYSIGRPSDGLTQAMTTSFRVAGVDKDALFAEGGPRGARAMVEPYFQRAREQGDLVYPHRDFVQFYDYPRPGVLHFNMTRINRVSGISAEDLTRAEVEGRRQAFVLADWLVRAVPWFRGAWLEKVACQVGVRETRHVRGLYAFSQDDVCAGRKFADGIARSRYFIDIHSPTGAGFDHEPAGAKGGVKPSYGPPPGDWYEVPYRAIVPTGIDNLLAPCRAFSATHEGAAAVRVMATMTALGHAAGLAAATISSTAIPAADLDAATLRRDLAYLDAPPELGEPW